MGNWFLQSDLQRTSFIYRQASGHVGVKCDSRELSPHTPLSILPSSFESGGLIFLAVQP